MESIARNIDEFINEIIANPIEHDSAVVLPEDNEISTLIRASDVEGLKNLGPETKPLWNSHHRCLSLETGNEEVVELVSAGLWKARVFGVCTCDRVKCILKSRDIKFIKKNVPVLCHGGLGGHLMPFFKEGDLELVDDLLFEYGSPPDFTDLLLEICQMTDPKALHFLKWIEVEYKRKSDDDGGAFINTALENGNLDICKHFVSTPYVSSVNLHTWGIVCEKENQDEIDFVLNTFFVNHLMVESAYRRQHHEIVKMLLSKYKNILNPKENVFHRRILDDMS